MALDNTTILPVGDSTASRNLLTGLLNENVLLVVIFGNDANAQKAQTIADFKAKTVTAGISRKVAWMQDKSMLSLLMGLLKPGDIPSSDIDLSQHIGISVSLADVLMYLIPTNPAPTEITMELAFVAAGM